LNEPLPIQGAPPQQFELSIVACPSAFKCPSAAFGRHGSVAAFSEPSHADPIARNEDRIPESLLAAFGYEFVGAVLRAFSSGISI